VFQLGTVGIEAAIIRRLNSHVTRALCRPVDMIRPAISFNDSASLYYTVNSGHKFQHDIEIKLSVVLLLSNSVSGIKMRGESEDLRMMPHL
jgi:hypothetical protein